MAKPMMPCQIRRASNFQVKNSSKRLDPVEKSDDSNEGHEGADLTLKIDGILCIALHDMQLQLEINATTTTLNVIQVQSTHVQ